MKISQHVSELVIRLTDLAEAEGRVLHRVLENATVRLGLMVAAGILLLAGAGLLFAGIWLGISTSLGPAWASAITGAIAIALGVGVLALAGRRGR